MYADQYELEATWSNRATDDIILDSIKGKVSHEMGCIITDAIKELGCADEASMYVGLFSFILKDKAAKPIQAIATQLGHVAGKNDAIEAFEWGVSLLKLCKISGLYDLVKGTEDGTWYVIPNFVLSKVTKQKLDKLQYLPPMQVVPLDWSSHTNGGYLYERKNILLGKKFCKHDKPLAYDAINKLQKVAFCIDTETYLTEKETNRTLNKKKFLRVLNEYIDKPFHFVWRYDSRGRSYCSGYHLSIQSNEYGKALLSLYNKEPITTLDNLYIAIANHAGHDKLTWDERINWTHTNINTSIKWKEPMLGRKALRALEDAKNGKPSGYMVSADATTSGYQILAVLSGCKETALLTNCIDPTTRHDLYTKVANLMNGQLDKPVHRAVIKKCVMRHGFNSTKEPKILLSEKGLKVFYRVMKGLLPGAEEVKEIVNSCWNADADHHTWTLPDGHTAYIPVGTKEGVDVTYTDSELGEVPLRFFKQMPSDNYRSLLPNIVHSVDGYVAREMVRRCDFQMVHVHDNFLCSPDHLQDMCRIYREIMAEIAKSDLLQDILRQITGDVELTITKYSIDLDKDILGSSYMLS